MQRKSDIKLKQTYDDFIYQAIKNIKIKIRGNVRTRRGRIMKGSLQLPEQFKPKNAIQQQSQQNHNVVKRKILRKRKVKSQGLKQQKFQKLEYSQNEQQIQNCPYLCGQTYNIPTDLLDQDSTSFYHFNISGKVITRLGGAWYQPMFLKYPLPSKGKHKMAIRLQKTQRSIFWIGVIAQYVKNLAHSSIWRDYFIYKVSSGQIISNIQGVQQKIKTKCQILPVKGTVQMLIDMDKKQITFILSNGGVATGSIPQQLLKKYKLVPFVCIYSTYDSLQFL